MKFISQFIIIIAFTFIGELLHFFIPLPIPASIYGIVLLFICLMMKWIKVTEIRETIYYRFHCEYICCNGYSWSYHPTHGAQQ